jgi:DNA-binding XRE family transcriptional regulator
MFITGEEARRRAASPDNLANLFNINKTKAERERSLNAKDAQSGISKTEEEGSSIGTKEQESESIQSLSTGLEHRELRSPGQRRSWLPTEERTQIAIAASTSGRSQEEIAQEHGISRQAVAQIKAGSGLRDEKALEDAIELAREKALNRLMCALGLLTDDKISSCDAKAISHIAANMAKVVEKTMPDDKKQQVVQLIVYAPEQRSEKSFNVVEI